MSVGCGRASEWQNACPMCKNLHTKKKIIGRRGDARWHSCNFFSLKQKSWGLGQCPNSNSSHVWVTDPPSKFSPHDIILTTASLPIDSNSADAPKPLEGATPPSFFTFSDYSTQSKTPRRSPLALPASTIHHLHPQASVASASNFSASVAGRAAHRHQIKLIIFLPCCVLN